MKKNLDKKFVKTIDEIDKNILTKSKLISIILEKKT